MDILSYNVATIANDRIEKFNANPDSNSGVLTQPKVIEAGQTVTIKSGRQAILANILIEGDLVVEAGGEVFVPAGDTSVSDITAVKLTGNQTVGGIKTFTSSPIVPTPTTDFQVATKQYVDNLIGSGGSNYSKSKTSSFNAIPILASGNPSGYQYYIDETVSGMTSSINPLVFPNWSTLSDMTTYQDDWNKITAIESKDNILRFYFADSASVNIKYIVYY